MKKIIYLLGMGLLTTLNLSAQQFGNTIWSNLNLKFEKKESVYPPLRSDSQTDYSKGVFIVNEDWYGHQNSTINFLTNEGEWYYRVFQQENPGKELGCTSQYGTIYGDKLYIVSKQQQDPGAKVKGSRFAVCDAKTMKLIKDFEFIASKTVAAKDGKDSLVSIADGRSYCPVDETKGYIGTSNGIWIYDSEKMEIGTQIEGSGNPNSDDYGQLYYGQIGTMIRANDYVFAVHQQNGIFVIDPTTDKIIETIKASKDGEIQRGFGSIVRSKDGDIWASMAADIKGTGAALDYMLKINPMTLHIDTVHIPLKEKGIGIIPNSWYAWTADGFCASQQENKIYWNGQDEKGSWFTGYQIYCYDIDKDLFTEVIDITKLPGDWRLYGTGFRIHPETDDIYAFLYHSFQDPTHQLAVINSSGEMINQYSMISNYWFPAIPVFPDNYAPEFSEDFLEELVCNLDGENDFKLYLGDKAFDKDNQDCNIIKTIKNNTLSKNIKCIIRNDSLIIQSPEINNIEEENGNLTLQFNSNGNLIEKCIKVKVKNISTANENIENDCNPINYYHESKRLSVNCNEESLLMIYDLSGKIVLKKNLKQNKEISLSYLNKGAYIVTLTTQNKRYALKFSNY